MAFEYRISFRRHGDDGAESIRVGPLRRSKAESAFTELEALAALPPGDPNRIQHLIIERRTRDDWTEFDAFPTGPGG